MTTVIRLVTLTLILSLTAGGPLAPALAQQPTQPGETAQQPTPPPPAGQPVEPAQPAAWASGPRCSPISSRSG